MRFQIRQLSIVVAFALSLGIVLLSAHPILANSSDSPSVTAPVRNAAPSRMQPLSTIAQNQPAPSTEQVEQSAVNPPDEASMQIACNPKSHGVKEFAMGTVSYCKAEDGYPMQDTDIALVELEPGASRAPHWHPGGNWERQVLLEGKVKTTVIDPEGKIHEGILEQGQNIVSYIPAGYPHWSTNIGDTTAKLVFVFPTGFKTAELGQTAAQVAPNVLNETIQVTIPDAIRDERRSIVPWN